MPDGTEPPQLEMSKVDVKQLVEDVFKETRQALTSDDPIMIAAFLNRRLLEGMADQVATVAATAASNAAARRVRIMLDKHEEDLGVFANKMSEMIEENILAAARDGAALVSGSVHGSAQAVGQSTLDHINKFSGVVRRIEYLVYATLAGLAVLVVGIAIGRFV